MAANKNEVPRIPALETQEPPKVPLNIYQRVNEVRMKVWYVRKDKTVETGGKPYKATTHDAVTALVRNHLIEHGVLIVPKLISSAISQVGETKHGTPIWRYEAKYDIEFVNCDQPDDKIVVPAESHANDSGDKAPGKAVSYATKGVILKVFNIETGEDDESRVEPYGGVPRVSAEQVTLLKEKIAETEADEEAFLKYLKAETLEDIPARAFDTCVKLLRAKGEQSKKSRKTPEAE
jgi:hypothetical protein